MSSIWSESLKNDSFKTLCGNLKTDVLIIGGGMAGVLCAYHLHQLGIDYVLIEGGKIGGGITKNTTAKITAQHGLIYNNLLQKFGAEKARAYLMSNLSAMKKYREISANVDCDFEEMPSYVYTISDKKKIVNEINALQKLGYAAEFAEKLPLPLDIKGAVKFPSQAQFNPIKFISGISKAMSYF